MLCTIVIYKTAQRSYDNHLSHHPDNQHCSNVSAGGGENHAIMCNKIITIYNFQKLYNKNKLTLHTVYVF